MMPEMDGYAFVDHVRKDDRTSWIPVHSFPPRVKAKIGLRVLTLERMSTWLSRLSQKNWWLKWKLSNRHSANSGNSS